MCVIFSFFWINQLYRSLGILKKYSAKKEIKAKRCNNNLMMIKSLIIINNLWEIISQKNLNKKMKI